MDLLKQLMNPTYYKHNRLDAHSDHKFFDGEHRSQSVSLNGMWKMAYSKRIADRPIDFYKTDYPISDFYDIVVPGHAELQGFGGIQYVNTQYPWDGLADLNPPEIDPEDSPVLSYVTFFDLPEMFADKRVCINFCGVEQAFTLYLNGEYVGFSQDSFTPAHFDLTPFIKEKDNRLCVEVYKRTCFGWMEDQDFFRFSGIFRDVILYAKPKIHIEDLFVIPTVDENLKNGELTVKFKISGTDKPSVKISLKNPCGDEIYSYSPQYNLVKTETLEPAENVDEYFVSPTIPIDNISLWDKFAPNLYELTLCVHDGDEVVEYVVQDVGFRRFEIKGNALYLNNKRLVINGVNRHEWHAAKGRAISAEDMIADIEVFKRNNIDSVRTSHYPNQSLWYELCDKNGITMVDEANIESHGTWQKNNAVHVTTNVPGSLPNWRDVAVDRAVSMFERDKNHPSILFWSCGNESYAGENILAMANFFRRKDSSRFVHYEGVFHCREFEAISDVESQMYTTPSDCEQYLGKDAKKPFFLCEYMHDMGNSLGGFESYMNLYDKYENYHGGYIWDYMDQALYQNVGGERVLGYGGDFIERPSDYNFSGNGIVFADRSEKPAMQEVKYWYSSPEKRAKWDRRNAEFSYTPPTVCKADKGVKLIEGNLHYGVVGDGFSVLFSTVKGGPVSINYGGTEWLRHVMKPTYHRAPTENDSACGFPQKSGAWSLADRYSTHTDMTAELKGGVAVVTYTYDTLQGNTSVVCYTVDGNGRIAVEAKFNGKKGLPQLPLFGMQFATPTAIERFDYVGYSGETYPDRHKGGEYGAHSELVSGQMPAYLVPQECGAHSYSKMFALKNGDKQLRFVAEDNFHFSVLPYSTAQLEEAWHAYELPKSHNTHVRILAELRGVGGINTWGADVEEQYHVSAEEDIVLRFCITGA